MTVQQVIARVKKSLCKNGSFTESIQYGIITAAMEIRALVAMHSATESRLHHLTKATWKMINNSHPMKLPAYTNQSIG
jgi:hypothetical protein